MPLKTLTQSLLLSAVIWATIFHNVLWFLSAGVLFALLGAALCIWAGLRLFAAVPGSGATASAPSLNPVPSLNIHSAWIWGPVVWLGLILVVQTIPLPVSLVALISPHRAVLAQRLSDGLPGLESRFITLSADANASRKALPFFIFPIIVFMLGNFLASSRRRVRGIIRFLLWLTIIEAVYGLFEQLTGHHFVLWVARRADDASGTFLNRNHFAATLSLFLPASIGWLYYRASRAMRDADEENLSRRIWAVLNSAQGFGLLAPPILSLGILQGHSRGGFSSMTLGVALLFFAGLRNRVARAFGALGIALAVVLMAYTISSDYQFVLDRFQTLTGSGKNFRMATWRNSLEIFADYPAVGIGPGNFADIYRHYEDQSLARVPYQAHNEWLEGFVTFGLVGMGPLLIAVVICFVKAFRIIRRAGRDMPWLLGIWCGLIGLGLHSFVEFPLHLPNLAITSALLMGLFLGFERLLEKEPPFEELKQ